MQSTVEGVSDASRLHSALEKDLGEPGAPRADIAKISVEECLRIAGLQPGELDVLDGSPPCQGFQLLANAKWMTAGISGSASTSACSVDSSRKYS